MKLIEFSPRGPNASLVNIAGTPTEIGVFRNTATSLALGALASRQDKQSSADDVYELLDELASTAPYVGRTEVLYLDQVIREGAIDYRKKALATAAVHGNLDPNQLRREIKSLNDFEWIDDDVLLTHGGYRAEIRDEEIVPTLYDIAECLLPIDNIPAHATHFMRRYATIVEPLDTTDGYQYELIQGGSRMIFGTQQDGLFVPV